MKKINEVSKIVGVSKRTLQFYDDEGLIFIERSSNNHRMYDQKALEQIWKILVYKELGFELKEIKSLLTLSEEKKKGYLSKLEERMKSEMTTLKVQMEMNFYVQEKGMPLAPSEESGTTYREEIEKLKDEIRKRVGQE